MKHAVLRAAALICVFVAGEACAEGWLRAAEKVVKSFDDRTTTVQHSGAIEVGFSPNEGGEKLILKVINSARSEIRVSAYSFTSVPVVEALLAAKKRGVDVALVVDYKANVSDDRGKSRAGLSALVNAGCRVRTVSAYPIHHDKMVISDRETVETGSFNYSDAAARKNSENVLVIWKNPELARVYLGHWNDRFSRGDDFRTNY